MTKAISRTQPSKPARPPSVDPAPLAPAWPGTGLCAEAQADGVPCPDLGCRCERCARAAEPLLRRPL